MSVVSNRKSRRKGFALNFRALIIFCAAAISITLLVFSEIQRNRILEQSSLLMGHPHAQMNANAVSRKVNKLKKKPIVLPSDFEGLKLLAKDDPIYHWGTWDEAPIVIESHKLLFFTIPKVGCTVFKQLFRRMYGYHNWRAHDKTFPHQPIANGLNYLYHYKPHQAEKMLTDPSWTRAIFFRDPKERLLSAYLDKVTHEKGKYVRVHCCGSNPSLKALLQCQVPVDNLPDPLLSFSDFLHQIVPECVDPHWRAQAHRLEEKFWPYINFVGHMDRIQQDTKLLLQRIGAWDEYGASGWESGAIFAGAASVSHATDAARKVSTFYKSPELIRLAETLHKIDYEHPVVSKSSGR